MTPKQRKRAARRLMVRKYFNRLAAIRQQHKAIRLNEFLRNASSNADSPHRKYPLASKYCFTKSDIESEIKAFTDKLFELPIVEGDFDYKQEIIVIPWGKRFQEPKEDNV